MLRLARIMRFPPKKAKKMGKAAGGAGKKTGGDFESVQVTDPKVLQSTCVGLNMLKEGGEEVQLKDDSEYPDWLWEMDVTPKTQPEHFEEGTEEYYRAIEKKNWQLDYVDRRKIRYWESWDRYAQWENYVGPMENEYITSDPSGELAKKLYKIGLSDKKSTKIYIFKILYVSNFSELKNII